MNDQDVRDLMQRAGRGIPVVSEPPEQYVRRARRDRRARMLAQLTGVAALVIAVVVGGTVWSGARDAAPAPDPADTAKETIDAAPRPQVPPGTRLVGAGGAYVAVPEMWVTRQNACPETVPQDTVSFVVETDASLGCPEPYPDARMLEVAPFDMVDVGYWLRRAGPMQEVNGLQVAEVSVHAAGSTGPYEGAVVLPEEEVVFSVSGPTPAGLQSILDSVQALPEGWVGVPADTVRSLTESSSPAEQAVAMLDNLGFDSKLVAVAGAGRTDEVVGSFPAIGEVARVGSTVAVFVAADKEPPSRLTCESDRTVAVTLDLIAWPGYASPVESAAPYVDADAGESLAVDGTGGDTKVWVLRSDGTARAELGLFEDDSGWGVDTLTGCTGADLRPAQ